MNYLGFKINAQGIHPDNCKVKAVNDAPAPKNVKELQAFLGLLNFYRQFLPKAATFLEPLTRLLRGKGKWEWGSEQQTSFDTAKSTLLNSQCLVHFNPAFPIVLSADSSSYGIGAALAHVINGEERPICFASRTLTTAERHYSQLEREALALIFALKKFHFYIYGIQFTMKTDHKPLLGIFSPTKQIPLMSSGRIQRWCLMMQAYKFELLHSSGTSLGNVDALSRLPLPTTNESVPVPAEWVKLVRFLEEQTPIEAPAIAKETAKDPVLKRLLPYVHLGWPDHVSKDCSSYFARRNDISLQSG